MGTWGAGPFENDGAGDLLASIRAGDFDLSEWDWSEEDYLEVDGGQVALAMAQLVVSAREGAPVPGLDDLTGFTGQLTEERIDQLRALVRLTLSDPDSSELYELWADSDELDEWLAASKALLQALESAES